MTPLEIALALLVTLAMLAQGLDLELSKLSETLRAPRVLLWGLGLNIVLLPLAVLLTIRVAGLSAALAAALLLCAAAPGGGTGGLLAASVKGDMALATALQVLLAGSLVLTPFWLAFGLPQRGDTHAVITAALKSVVLFQWLPLIAGLWLRRQHAPLAARLHPWAKQAANLILLALIIVLFWRDGARMLDQDGRSLLAIGLLVVVGFGVAGVLPGTRAERATLRMITVNRNLSLALLLAASFFQDPAVLMLILIYALIMYLGCAAYIAVIRLTKPVIR